MTWASQPHARLLARTLANAAGATRVSVCAVRCMKWYSGEEENKVDGCDFDVGLVRARR